MGTMEELEGIVEEIIFRNDDNGCGGLLRAGKEEQTVVGTLPFIKQGERCTFWALISITRPSGGR